MRSEKLQGRKAMQTPTAGKKPRTAKKPAATRARPGLKTADVLGRASSAVPSSAAIPKKWRWHNRVLLSLQSRLLRERGDLLQAAAEPLERHSLDEADSATDEFDHDLALSELSAEQNALYEVEAALSRIRNGTYGVCEETGQTIPAARLRAIPWARFTREVEERLEKEGRAPQAHLNKATTVRKRGRIWLAPEEEAEETEEVPPASPKDEELASVFSPPVSEIPLPKKSPRRPKTAKRKGGRP